MGLPTFHSLSPVLVGERGSILGFLEPYKKKREIQKQKRREGEQKKGTIKEKKKKRELKKKDRR